MRKNLLTAAALALAASSKAQPPAALKLVRRLPQQEKPDGDLAKVAHAVLLEALRHPEA